MTKKPAYLAFPLLLVLSGCGDDGGSDGGRDGGTDAGPPRDGGQDAGTDGGPPPDGGVDSGMVDCPAMTVPPLALMEIASGLTTRSR
jgi:hypothetical protein